MTCSECGAGLPPEASMCPACGAARKRFCTECGSALSAGAKFCAECGHRVTAAAGAPAAAPPRGAERRPEGLEAPDPPESSRARSQPAPAPPEPTLPPELRAKLESVRSELSGERRQVVVLFADLSGFTEMSESMDPEDVSLLMNRILSTLADAVYRYEGYVDKFIGDSVMALFGAPFAHEDDPERAVLSGLAMLEAIRDYNRAGGKPLALRVGINVGDVVAAHLGSGGRLQYTVMGDTVNVASRLEGKAAPDSILVSESVYRRVASRFRAEKLAALELKGKTELIQAYRILGFQPRETLHTPSRAPFSGRDAELRALAEFLERLPRGEARALLVEGEAGSGKSRLVREALARPPDEVATVEVAFTAIRLPGQRPPAAEMFHQLLPEEPPGRAAADRALALLGHEADAHREGIEGLAREADPSLGADVSGDVDPAVARQNRWAALTALLRSASTARPVVLLADDVHWIDEASQELLEFLSVTLAGQPFAMLLTAREGPPAAWLPPGGERLRLGPLERGAAEALLGGMLDELDPGERRELLRRSEGNPLYLEELALALRDGPQRIAGAPVVPGTLQALLVSRIDRLEPAVRRLLQMASVLGTRFPTRLLRGLYELEPQEELFDRALERLEAGGFLEVELNGEDLRRFHHALIQEVSYGGLLQRIRKVLHESVARLGEDHYAGRVEVEAPFFAHHWWEAGLPEAAAPHLWTAGRLAAESYDLPAAERFLDRLATVVGDAAGPLEDVVQRALYEETFGAVLLHRGRLDDAEHHLVALEELGAAHGRSEWIARALEHRGRIAWYRGRLHEAQWLFERGLVALPGGDGPITADLHNGVGNVLYYRGQPHEAFAEHTRALRIRERLGDRLGTAKSTSNIGNILLYYRDDVDGAEAHYRQALELARAVGDRRETSSAINNLGIVAMERGDWEGAMSLFRQAGRIQEEMGWSFLSYLTLLNQVRCELPLGRVGDALRHLRVCIEKGQDVLEPMNRVNIRLSLFDASFRALQNEQAEEALREAARIAGELGVDELEDELRLREGRLLGARGEWEAAARAFETAEATAMRLGHPSVARLATAHRCRALSRAGGSTELCADDAGGRPPVSALIGYLNADVEACSDPSPRTAAALSRVGVLARQLGETCLAKAAWTAEAQVWRTLARNEEEGDALRRAADCARDLELNLPEELRAAFADHPLNASLRVGGGWIDGGNGARGE